MMKTSVVGIFAAGDVRDTGTKQVVGTAGKGKSAALKISKYLKTVEEMDHSRRFARSSVGGLWGGPVVIPGYAEQTERPGPAELKVQ